MRGGGTRRSPDSSEDEETDGGGGADVVLVLGGAGPVNLVRQTETVFDLHHQNMNKMFFYIHFNEPE